MSSKPEKAGKHRPQVTVDPDTYALAKVMAREDGGSVANLVRGLVRKTACQYFNKPTVRDVLAELRASGQLETRGGAA